MVGRRKKYTKEEIITALQRLAQELGTKKLRKADVGKIIPNSTIARRFGSFGKALEEAGLEKIDQKRPEKISDDDLFGSFLEVERRLGHEPRTNEYSANGKFSVKPFMVRFGKWPDVLKHYRKWKAENPEALKKEPHEETTHSPTTEEKSPERHGEFMETPKFIKGKQPKQLFGELLEFRGLRHAPINEQGVVYLFGMVSRELGFSIESLQQGFPDCEGKYLYDPKKQLWAKARIEIEYRASNFKDHCHNSDECDFIVCWINDWPDCPIDVIELRTEIQKLPSK